MNNVPNASHVTFRVFAAGGQIADQFDQIVYHDKNGVGEICYTMGNDVASGYYIVEIKVSNDCGALFSDKLVVAHNSEAIGGPARWLKGFEGAFSTGPEIIKIPNPCCLDNFTIPDHSVFPAGDWEIRTRNSIVVGQNVTIPANSSVRLISRNVRGEENFFFESSATSSLYIDTEPACPPPGRMADPSANTLPVRGTQVFGDSTDSTLSERPKSFPSISLYPNPFSREVTFSFVMPESVAVTVRVSDMLGRVVATPWENKVVSAGVSSWLWDGSGLSDGVYVVSVSAGPSSHTLKLVKAGK